VEEHYWAGCYFGTIRDLLGPAKTAIITEFGAQALPRLSTLKTIIPPEVRWPKTTAADDPGWTRWKYHNFQPFQTFKFAKIPRGDNLQEMIANTQAYQAQLVATAAESYRRQPHQPGTAPFHFFFVETLLPSIEPVTAQWQPGQPATVGLWAINDTWSACDQCQLKWQVKQDRRVLDKGETTLTIPADSGQKVQDVTVTPAGKQDVEINYWIEDRQGKKVGENQLRVQPGVMKE